MFTTHAQNLKSKVIKPARMLNLRTSGIVLSCRDAYMMEAGAGVPKWLACKGQHVSIRAGSAIRSGIGVLTFLEAQQCLLHNGASCIATVMITIAFGHTLSTISDHARTNIARCCDDRKYCAPRCIGNLPRAILMKRTVRPQHARAPQRARSLLALQRNLQQRTIDAQAHRFGTAPATQPIARACAANG